MDTLPTNNNIAQNSSDVKAQFSLSDYNSNQLTQEQIIGYAV